MSGFLEEFTSPIVAGVHALPCTPQRIATTPSQKWGEHVKIHPPP
ncbi:hypothetical protein DAD186_06020 [Dermabacter vaginalis]|uniref:Uncharacterized protein n=1 Tax=Dermabacter vaginalis TaxID=1630135 RepID=A0A1B0ZGW7_9MICO|nr:hypothetical protein DAD186_06020 [Dermabacter vaginalis]